MDDPGDSSSSAISVSLFERGTLQEWEAAIPVSSGSDDSGWSSIRPSQLLRLFGAKSLPESLLFFVEQGLRWNIAYSTVHYAIAIQKDGYLEIWRDYCSVPIAKCRILDDGHPQWCKLVWSASGNLLFSSRSTGAVDAFDSTGGFCFSIPTQSPDAGFNPLYCVASINSMAYTADTAWSDRVWILHYDGTIHYYLAGRVSGYHPLAVINVSGGPASIGITSALLPNTNIMLIATYDPDSPLSMDVQKVTDRGISTLRLIDDPPFLQRFGEGTEALDPNTTVAQKKSFALFQSSKEHVLQIVVNTDESMAACFTSRGDLLAFRIPSLQITRTGSLGDELSIRRENASFITGIGWWSKKEIMLLYSTGFVATVNLDMEGTTSAVEKNYSAWSQLICAAQGHVLLLEITDCPQANTVKKRTMASLIWPILRIPCDLLKLAGRAFVGAPLTGADTDIANVETVSCRYILHEMKAITPSELFRKKLIANNYDEALAVAETYCLNADRVYQEQWRKNAVTLETIDNYLVKVKSRAWIVDECLSQLPESLEACKKLLDIGLKYTDHLKTLATEKEIKSKQQACAARYRLLHYSRILADYEVMLNTCGGRHVKFEKHYYGAIRNLSLYEWSLKLARAAEFSRLAVLFGRYGRRLFPVWLLLLCNIPETVDLEDYDFLLPKRGKLPEWANQGNQKKEDFIENEHFAKFVEIKPDDAGVLIQDRQALKQFILSVDASVYEPATLVKNWYEFRALEIEQYSGLPDLAERFLVAATASGFTELDSLRDDMGLLRLLNYECSLSSPISYDRLKKMSPLETLQLLLKEAPKDVFMKRFEQWAVPFCTRAEQRNEIPAKTLIWKYMVSVSGESLSTPSSLFQSFNSKNGWWSERIGLTSTDIIRMAADCLAACGNPGQLEAGFRLVSYIPQPPEDDPDASIVQSLEDHLTALHLLNVYGITLSFKRLQETASSEKESVLLLRRLIRHGTSISTSVPTPSREGHSADKSGGGRVWTLDHWRALFKDMLQISRTVLPSIGEHRCQEIFLDGLLSAKSVDLINVASKFLTTTRDQQDSAGQQLHVPRLSYDSAAELVYQAAEDYVNEAVDARDDVLNYAKRCLNLLENPPDKITRELEFIEALPLLDYFGVVEVPARLKMYKNPVRLIEEIFSAKPTAYEEYDKLAKLCKFLRVPVVDPMETKCLLVMCAKQALGHRDSKECVKLCKEIASSKCSSGWRICWDACTELCTTPHFNSDVRYELLKFCLLHCEPSELEPILQSLQGLKAELLKKELDVPNLAPDGPWKTNVWNVITNKTKPRSVVNWSLDPFYMKVDSYRPEDESQPFDENCVELFNSLRYLQLNEEADRALVDNALAKIGTTIMSMNTHLAVVALLSVQDDVICEKALRAMPQSPMSAEMAVYIQSLRAARRSGVAGKELQSLLHSNPQTLMKEIYALPNVDGPLKGWVKTLNSQKQSMALTELPEGVDRDRFVRDDQYRTDTILGLALTAEEDQYLEALKLAENYGMDPWMINVAHLECLFTESDMDTQTLSESIKARRLLEKVSERRDEAYGRLMRNVFPLLDGRDNQMLLLFYAVQGKLANQNEITAINIHRAILKQLKQLAPDMDYKKLISDDDDALDVLIPYLTAENFTNFAKMVVKLPNKNWTLDHVLCVWAKKVFTETLQKSSVNVAFERCKKVLEKVNGESLLRFVKDIAFSPKMNEKMRTGKVRADFMQLSIQFASEREKFSQCGDQLKLWEKEIQAGSVK